MLTESSHTLNKALQHRAHISSATVVIPSSWSEARCGLGVSNNNNDDKNIRGAFADVVVSGERDSLRGDARPFTQQSGGCGERGDFVTLPKRFLDKVENDTRTSSEVFVSEFAKLRYGVFDQVGFARDVLYPGHFYVDGKLRPTLESEGRNVRGSWVGRDGQTSCNPTKSDCYFKPDQSENEAECALGYVPNAKRFCNKTTAPTKHNVLCSGKSPLQVIEDSEDFRNIIIANKARAAPDLNPTVNVVREPTPYYVLILETSSSSDQGGQWRWVARAAQTLVRDQLPVDARVAVVTFSSTAKVERALARASSDGERARLADAVPDRYHLGSSDGRCVRCAFERVVRDVLPPGESAGAHLLLITRGTADTLSPTDEQIVKSYVDDYGLKLTTFLTRPPGPPSASSTHLPFYSSASSSSSGRAYSISSSNGHVPFYASLSSALRRAILSDGLYPTESPVVLHTKSFVSGGPTVSSGEFLLDASLGRDTLFGILVQDAEEHGIRSVRFEDESGRVYGPFHRMSSLHDLASMKTVSFPSAPRGAHSGAPPFNAVSVCMEIQIMIVLLCLVVV